ncbi:MAG TPA: hypothetical protein VHX19_19855 [Stellaceae bacterium]|jgi:hypothetical protein|nr:hypothetical protein [Stellaceae bacterium]
MNRHERLRFLQETGAQMMALVDSPDLPLKVRAELRRIAADVALEAVQIETEIEQAANNNSKAG